MYSVRLDCNKHLEISKVTFSRSNGRIFSSLDCASMLSVPDNSDVEIVIFESVEDTFLWKIDGTYYTLEGGHKLPLPKGAEISEDYDEKEGCIVRYSLEDIDGKVDVKNDYLQNEGKLDEIKYSDNFKISFDNEAITFEGKRYEIPGGILNVKLVEEGGYRFIKVIGIVYIYYYTKKMVLMLKERFDSHETHEILPINKNEFILLEKNTKSASIAAHYVDLNSPELIVSTISGKNIKCWKDFLPRAFFFSDSNIFYVVKDKKFVAITPKDGEADEWFIFEGRNALIIGAYQNDVPLSYWYFSNGEVEELIKIKEIIEGVVSYKTGTRVVCFYDWKRRSENEIKMYGKRGFYEIVDSPGCSIDVHLTYNNATNYPYVSFVKDKNGITTIYTGKGEQLREIVCTYGSSPFIE